MYNKSQAKRYDWVKKSYVCNIFKNDISVICVTNIARGKNVWHKNIIEFLDRFHSCMKKMLFEVE